MIAEWKIFEGAECPECGVMSEVLTESQEVNWVYDGEPARCPECGLGGVVYTDGECASVEWNEAT